MPSPMESRLTLKFMALWWRVPVVTWLCTWPHAAVPDAHHADIDLDGHAVRGEGDQAGREAQFEVEAPLERALDRRIGRELTLRAAEEQLDVGEDAEALRLAEGDVAAVDRSERIGVAQRVVIVDAQGLSTSRRCRS